MMVMMMPSHYVAYFLFSLHDLADIQLFLPATSMSHVTALVFIVVLAWVPEMSQSFSLHRSQPKSPFFRH